MKWLLLLLLVFLTGCLDDSVMVCVPADCCHADSCVKIHEAPDCSGIVCSEECVNGTMDCGLGYCDYIDGECIAVYVKE